MRTSKSTPPRPPRGKENWQYVHGQSETRLYGVWLAMRRRCYNRNADDYPRYGGRGITVCPRWKSSFVNFESDMGEPGPGMSLERINNSGPYSPRNCRWATMTEQGRNKRNNLHIDTPLGLLTAMEIEERTGIGAKTIKYRVKAGWPKKVLLNPIGYRHRNRWDNKSTG